VTPPQNSSGPKRGSSSRPVERQRVPSGTPRHVPREVWEACRTGSVTDANRGLVIKERWLGDQGESKRMSPFQVTALPGEALDSWLAAINNRSSAAARPWRVAKGSLSADFVPKHAVQTANA
jgi:hypothetical protein